MYDQTKLVAVGGKEKNKSNKTWEKKKDQDDNLTMPYVYKVFTFSLSHLFIATILWSGLGILIHPI